MTIDEEFDVLADNIRRLKIEYEIFFNGGSKKPPVDLRSRVEFALKKFSDTQRLTSHQRFRYNTLAAKFSVFSDLWRTRMRAMEEGIERRVRAKAPIESVETPPKPVSGREVLFKEVILKPEEEKTKILKLYEALKECKETYHDASSLPPLVTFEKFVHQKTNHFLEAENCKSVEFIIVLVDEKIRFQAVPVRR